MIWNRSILILALLATGSLLNAQETEPTPCHSLLQNDATTSMHLLYDAPPTLHDLQQQSRHLLLDIDATGFFFDAEYATPMAKGYSVVGFRFSPTLTYGINERAQLRVGIHTDLFAGLDSLYKLRPIFSLVYKPSNWLTLVAGTIYGSHSHRLDVPVYDPSRWIYNYQEDGLQILTNTRFWQSDTWLDWSHYLTPWTADQERFTMGTQHEIRAIGSRHQQVGRDFETGAITQSDWSLWHLSLPLHFIANHRGGEVKTIDTNTVTTFNERVGLRAVVGWGKELRGNENFLTLDLPLYFYHLEDADLDRGGKAFYPTLRYEHQHHTIKKGSAWSFKTTLGYWHGDHYFSAQGSPLFWSVNDYSALHMPASAATVQADIRNILTFSCAFEHEYKKLNLGLQFDALYDMDLRKTDLLVGFYMRYNESFRLF